MTMSAAVADSHSNGVLSSINSFRSCLNSVLQIKKNFDMMIMLYYACYFNLTYVL